MVPNINDDLVPIDPQNPYEKVDMDALIEKYGKKKVDEAVKYLTYKKKPDPMPKDENPNYPILYVFRHGQSEDNIHMIFSGWRDSPLTAEGEKGALVIGDMLADKKIQMLISSDQERTHKTMEPVIAKNDYAKNLEIIVDKRLRERHYGDWHGHTKLTKHLADPEHLQEVRRGWDKPPPNGESVEVVFKRVDDLMDEILPLMKKEKINVAIACSGNSIRPIRKRLEGLTKEEAAHIETPTGKDYAAYSIK